MKITKENTHLTIKQIEAQDTYKVRLPVLRPGLTIQDCEFNDDNHIHTFHLGLYLNADLIGVVTFMKTNNEAFQEIKQYQLRGMAILQDYQGLKYGDILVETGESLVKERQRVLIWLNAREIAVNFYERNGFTISGNPFNIPSVGTHYMMSKTI